MSVLSPVIRSRITIDAPIAQVWRYVSDSSSARDWSIYFHHITPLPGVRDGQVGSNRRCFRRADETGIWWDELTLEIDPPHYRRILSYNLHGFRDPQFGEAETYVFQHYDELAPGRTRFAFATQKLRPTGAVALVKFARLARETKRLFRLNLTNIKAIVEANHNGGGCHRPHAYLEPGEHPLDA